MNSISPAAYREMIAKAAAKPKNKYGAKKTVIGSHTFDSTAEAKRYSHLFILQQQGEITELSLQPEYPIFINGVQVCKVKLDFRYRDKKGCIRIEDVKGKDTAVSRLKRKMVEAAYPGMKVEIIR